MWEAELFTQFGEGVDALLRIRLDVRREAHDLNHAAVLLEREQLLVVHIAADVGERAHAGMGRDDGSLGKPHGFHVGALGGMREIDHHPEAIHFGDDLAAERRETVVVEVALGFAGIRIGELAVAVVGERHVAAAAVVELLHLFEIVADGISVLDADDGDAKVLLVQGEDVGRREREAHVIGRDLFGEAMHGIELRDRLAVGAVKAFRRERALADVDDHERDIHAAFDHFRQIDLRGETHFVVAIGREVGGLDIVVRVELEDAAVNQFGFGEQCRVVGLRRTDSGCQLKQQARQRGNDELSLDVFQCILLFP